MKKRIYYLAVGLVTAAAFTLGSCSDDDDDKKLPQIDGYDNSNEVAEDNLVAHWTFDNTNEERLSNTNPEGTYGTVGFTQGQIGNALQLTEGVLVYPPVSAINSANSLNNFTVSLWVNVTGNKRTDLEGFTAFFGLIPTNVSDIWGDVVAAAETSHHLPTSDTLKLKNLLNTHPAAGGNRIEDNLAINNDATGEGAIFLGARRWAHYVMSWDASSGNFHLFADGMDVGGYTKRGDDVTPVGPLIMAVPVKPVFGSLASNDIGFTSAPNQQTWNPWATASIDDVRIYNTVLSASEITALYNLGSAGR